MSADTWHGFSQPVRALLGKMDNGVLPVLLLAWRYDQRNLEYLTTNGVVFEGSRIFVLEDHDVSV